MNLLKNIKQSLKNFSKQNKSMINSVNYGIPKSAITKNKDKDIFKHLGKLASKNITLKGTDNDYWIVYNRYNKTTYVACKSTKEIYFEIKGKHPNIEFN